jgi:hypothetical protein
VDVVHKKCEACGLKVARLGLPAEPRKKRWCSGCAKAHAGAEEPVHKMCEGCGLKQPSFGLPADGKKRWCSDCSKAHAGVKDLINKKCEGWPDESKRQIIPNGRQAARLRIE